MKFSERDGFTAAEAEPAALLAWRGMVEAHALAAGGVPVAVLTFVPVANGAIRCLVFLGGEDAHSCASLPARNAISQKLIVSLSVMPFIATNSSNGSGFAGGRIKWVNTSPDATCAE